MISIEEKRVYGDREGVTEAFVASGVGVCLVRVSDDIVGEFGLVARCVARDVAAAGDAVAVATDEDVLAFEGGTGERTDGDGEGEFAPTGFGPAVAVGYDGPDLLAASPDGRVARRRGGEWTDLESPRDLEVRGIDGDLLATADGVYRVRGDGLVDAGLADVHDVSAAGVPLAAAGGSRDADTRTEEGLYRLGNGWMLDTAGEFDAVAADPRSAPGELERAHAVAGSTVYEHVDGEWITSLEADEPVAAVAYGETIYAVTDGGLFLAAGEDGWRRRSLGIADVGGLATLGTERV